MLHSISGVSMVVLQNIRFAQNISIYILKCIFYDTFFYFLK